jgi:hypothetical protein
MLVQEKINIQIQKLETQYANRLAAGAEGIELSVIWSKIKDLKDQLVILQFLRDGLSPL